jgi:phasin
MSQSDPFSTVVKLDMPNAIREYAEKGVSQARDGYQKMRDAAQSGNEAIEAAFASASKGAVEYQSKMIEFSRANANATFDFAEKLIAVKSPSEAFALWTAHLRQQYETATAQTKDLAEMTKKVATDAFEPVKTSASKVLGQVA